MLKRLEERAWSRSLSHYDPLAPVTAWDLGRLSEAASVADDAILHVLATARANCHVKMTDAQLFGPAPAAEEHEQDDAPEQADEAPAEPEVAVPEEAPAGPEEGHRPQAARDRVRAV